MSEQTENGAYDVSALSEALKDTHRHIEELERIQAGGGRGVITSEARDRARLLTERIIALSQSRMDFPAPGVAPEWIADCMSPAHVIRILLSEAHDRWGDCLEVPRKDLVAWLSSRITQWSASAARGGPAINTQEAGYLAHMTWERKAGVENECDAERRIRESTEHGKDWWHGWLARSDEWRAEIGHGSDHGETDDK